jgi:hypothetical protein
MLINKDKENSVAVVRLIALWALGESGLGGMMHALKIPFTGFFVGGLAVILISLIAFYSDRKFYSVLQATLLVLMVKAGVSPHSPVPAYIAVAFQGLAGALLFSLIRNFKLAAIVFSFISLVESAIQKFLFTTLLFGKSIWEGLDIFVKSVLNDLHVPSDFSFSFYLVSTYVLVYAVWGLILGFFIGTLPLALHELKNLEIEAIDQKSSTVSGKKSLSRFFPLALLVVCLVAVFLLEGMMNKAVYVLIRSIAVTLLLYFIARPIIIFFLNRAGNTRKAELNKVLVLMPEIRSYVAPAYRLACENHKGFKRFQFFVLYLIAATINSVD